MSALVRALVSPRPLCCRIASRQIFRNYATEVQTDHPALRHDVKPTTYGQPLSQSHPLLVKSNETTPGIPSAEYESRRRKLMDSLPDGSLVVSVAAPVRYMSATINFAKPQTSGI
ncbi:hypothetical protein HGRIS_009182 [Hohenbuehelia grisea]|uniref:Uncharacterized protein n=1 Tax=Hohenbuehelia grisea TaxID=104357 RepID=A0ABR3J0T4_9AGAR